MRKLIVSVLLLLLIINSVSFAGEKKPVKPSAKDKCPVCGMFVVKYPDWVAQILFNDGSYAVFDGVKDMMKYRLNIKKYNPSMNISDIDSIYVTDYYVLKFVDAKKAFYVLGSDVYGPMGRELIPFEKEADARGFMKDHKGQKVVTFQEITEETLKLLE